MENLGIIKNITEIYDYKIEKRRRFDNSIYFDEYEGYKVETDKSTYYVLIEGGQNCCEYWGYLSSDDKLDKYIGCELKDVYVTDTALNTKLIEIEDNDYCFDSMFVNFNLTNGMVFQLAVYNSHNGYYGHDIILVKDNEIVK